MSILAQIKNQEEQPSGDKIFGLVTGKSGSGKTTLAGSLPGHTLLIQIKGKEFGSETAKALANKLGNKVTSFSVANPEQLLALAAELAADTTYDNVYVDGISAMTNVIAEEPAIRDLIEGRNKGNPWSGYERINNRSIQIREAFAPLTYVSGADHPKHVFFTLAVRVDTDGEGNPEVVPEMKGKATYSTFTRPSPTLVHVAEQVTQEDGEEVRRRVLVTKDTGAIVARVNGLLTEENPGIINANLGDLIALIEGAKNGK